MSYKKERLYVDIHAVQTVPPSCVNRDDTGSPKTAVYGGTVRARVSSQSWKHAIRGMFIDLLEKEDVGKRTKMVKDLLVEQISKLSPGVDTQSLAEKVMELAGLKVDKKTGKTGALFFISDAQINALAELAINGDLADDKAKAKVKQALKENPSADMALFGRMVADDPSLNYDAACQVAHAISTHTIHNEYDYFTAVDDCSAEDNAGAGHLGTTEYNSATLYRYATVDVKELEKSVGNKTADIVCAFAEAFICSMPTGKQNTFANRTMPDMVYISIRKDQPINLAGAYEKPIEGRNGYSEASVKALSEYAEAVYEDFACRPSMAFCCGKGAEAFGEKKSLKTILDELGVVVNQMMEE